MFNLVSLFGLVGDGLIIVSWIPKTIKTIKKGRTNENWSFIFIYVFASLILTIYSFLVSNLVFIILNGAVTLLSGIDLFYKIDPRRIIKSR